MTKTITKTKLRRRILRKTVHLRKVWIVLLSRDPDNRAAIEPGQSLSQFVAAPRQHSPVAAPQFLRVIARPAGEAKALRNKAARSKAGSESAAVQIGRASCRERV